MPMSVNLTQRDIAIVQRDWEKIETIADQAGTLLYDKLFTLAPDVRRLFPADLTDQKAKLLHMLGSAICGLSEPEVLMPIIGHLGRKHVRFGVRSHHYETLAVALLWTLRQGLGSQFGPENEAAWTKVYAVLADAMKPGLAG
jgi:hemoglobin-like flavoprotein